MQVVAWVVAAAVVVVAVLVLRTFGVADLQQTVRAAGFWAPALFVLLQAVVNVAPTPRTVFSLAAGVLFGSLAGMALAVVATTLSAALAFWLVRVTGGRLVARHADRPAARWVRARLDRSGLLAVVSLRLIPVLPFFVTNYAAALSGVRFTPYLFGTAIGILPGTAAIVVLGDAVVGDPPPALLAISVLCGIVGTAGALVAARRPAAGAQA
jgi:uncharacterized membrane protein YdjX (TVP38/TMEM64 family)